MSWYDLAVLGPVLVQVFFYAALGACIGSLTNVLVYRMPRDLGVVTPPSKCPSCDTRLTWRENIPIFGWILLGGRCRFCKTRISPEYPLVETFMALLYGATFALWYLSSTRSTWLGVDWGVMKPEWALNGLGSTWLIFTAMLLTLTSLTAMTLVDAKTYTIPLALAWVATIISVCAHTLNAGYLNLAHGALNRIGDDWVLRFADGTRWYAADGWLWSLPTPGFYGWGWCGGSIGAVLGLGVSVLLVKHNLIRASFADYDEWEQQAIAEYEAQREAKRASGEPIDEDDDETSGPAIWIQYPHARREMGKELAFLGAPAALAWAGWMLFTHLGGSHHVPLWLLALCGSLLGYLIGGGCVWAVRIGGSLLFGKEAMGIGDVHLMAAAGACFGWIDSVVGFFAAAFVALAWTLLSAVVGGKLKRAMPFGPFLAAGVVIAVFAKPLVEAWFRFALGSASPINLP